MHEMPGGNGGFWDGMLPLACMVLLKSAITLLGYGCSGCRSCGCIWQSSNYFTTVSGVSIPY